MKKAIVKNKDVKNKSTNDLSKDIDNILHIDNKYKLKLALKSFKKKLPHEWVHKINDGTGVNIPMIYKIMSGERKDIENKVIPFAIKLANEEQKRLGNLIKKMI